VLETLPKPRQWAADALMRKARWASHEKDGNATKLTSPMPWIVLTRLRSSGKPVHVAMQGFKRMDIPYEPYFRRPAIPNSQARTVAAQLPQIRTKTRSESVATVQN
jgi:hypothetical protein